MILIFVCLVAAAMTGLGLLALVGANESVARATRHADAKAVEAERWRDAYLDLTEGTNVRSLRESPSFGRIADLLAANEAERLDPDVLDWTQPAEWRDEF